MKQLFSIVLFLALLPALPLQAAESGSYEACTQTLREADGAGKKISQAQVAALIAASNKKCLSYVETGEWLNEVLFTALQYRPAYFVEAFSKAGSDIRNNITHELENPINDGIDLEGTYQALATTGKDSADKQALLSAVKLAGKKMGMDLK